MATILFNIFEENGHIAPTFSIARALKLQGHNVVYCGEPEAQELFIPNEFEFVPLVFSFDDEYWLGIIEKAFASILPDLVIGDVLFPYSSLIAHKMGVKYIRCSTSLPSNYEEGVPPPWSTSSPGEISADQIELEWACRLGHQFDFWTHSGKPGFVDTMKIVQSSGISPGQIEMRTAFCHFIVRSDPELVLCSNAIDWPRKSPSTRIYAGPCLPEYQEDEEWSFEGRRKDAPLVLCAFGSQSARLEGVKQIIAPLIHLASKLDQIDFVIAVSKDLQLGVDAPSNVHFFDWIPQRNALDQATLFVSCGGLGSIKEAIWAGVPILVCPLVTDQHGNAARVVYHKIGLALSSDQVSEATLEMNIHELLESSMYRKNVARLQQVFIEEAMPTEAVDFINQILDKNRSVCPTSIYEETTRKMLKAIYGSAPVKK